MPRLPSIRTTKTVATHCLLAYPMRIQPGSEPRCKPSQGGVATPGHTLSVPKKSLQSYKHWRLKATSHRLALVWDHRYQQFVLTLTEQWLLWRRVAEICSSRRDFSWTGWWRIRLAPAGCEPILRAMIPLLRTVPLLTVVLDVDNSLHLTTLRHLRAPVSVPHVVF